MDATGEPIWEVQQVYITLPAGQNPPPQQRDEAGLAESLNVLQHNLITHLSDGKFERSAIDILGVQRGALPEPWPPPAGPRRLRRQRLRGAP